MFMKKNVIEMRISSIVDSLIVLDREAKKHNRNFIIAFCTDWIPGYNEKQGYYYKQLNPFFAKLRFLTKRIHESGVSSAGLTITGQPEAIAGPT